MIKAALVRERHKIFTTDNGTNRIDDIVTKGFREISVKKTI